MKLSANVYTSTGWKNCGVIYASNHIALILWSIVESFGCYLPTLLFLQINFCHGELQVINLVFKSTYVAEVDTILKIYCLFGLLRDRRTVWEQDVGLHAELLFDCFLRYLLWLYARHQRCSSYLSIRWRFTIISLILFYFWSRPRQRFWPSCFWSQFWKASKLMNFRILFWRIEMKRKVRSSVV